MESVIRNVRQPVMVMTTPEFTPPEGFVVAFDGSTTARRAVEAVARSPLLRGMPGLLAMAGEPHAGDAGAAARRPGAAAAGFAIDTLVVPGLPEEALPALLQSLGNMLLVLGAYGHCASAS